MNDVRHQTFDVKTDKLFTLSDISELFNVTRQTFKKYVKEGQAPEPIMLLGKERWPSTLVNQWILERAPHLASQQSSVATAAAAAVAAQEAKA